MPWLEPFLPFFEASDPRASGRLELGRLDELARARGVALEDGRPLRFTESSGREGLPYELAIAETGCVPTRVAGPGMLHDWFNALCWLRWPAIKARLNRLQADAIRTQGGVAVRGPLRDAITLFDESGALFVSDDSRMLAHWRGFDWQALFVAGRHGFGERARVLIVGHALLEKLLAPYKAICAHAMAVAPPRPGDPARARAADGRGHPPAGPLDLDAPDRDGLDRDGPDRDGPDRDGPDLGALGLEALDLDALDRSVAASLDAAALAREGLGPLPLLGIPGWWPANEDPAFYNDPRVFRQGRQRSSRR